MNDEDERWMRQALALAADGMTRGEMPIAALVVADGELVASAHTEEKTQGRLLVHADLLALDRADPLLRGGRRSRATLYVTLEPCLMCFGAAFTVKVGRVVFGLESPTDGGLAATRSWDEHRDVEGMATYRLPEIVGGVLRSECAAPFRTYAEEVATVDWARDWAADLAERGGA